MNIRRFARLLQILKPKDFDLYCESIKNSVEPICEKLTAVNLNAMVDEENKPRYSFSDFLEMKDQYYVEMLGNDYDQDFADMSTNYVKIIQWTLYYYYRGIPTWNYCYPYKCVPFVSDFTTVNVTTFSVLSDEPENPFTHLLAILPKSKCYLLPTCFQPLAVDEVHDFVSWLILEYSPMKLD